MKLDHATQLPEGLAAIGPREIRTVFPNPTLLHLEGRRKDPLFVCTLLHGNEDTSFYVLQRLARHLREHPLARSLMIFVGNVEAAEANMRYFPGRADMNRVWKDNTGTSPEHKIAAEVKAAARRQRLFASVDIHNNSGPNPSYACVNRLRPDFLHLGSLFSRTIMHFTTPDTVQCEAFAEFCPAVTLECGQSGTRDGVEHAWNYVHDILNLDHLPASGPPAQPVSVFESLARTLMEPDVDFDFGEADAEVVLPAGLERRNFSDVPAGTAWARVRRPVLPFRVMNDDDEDVTRRYFFLDGDIVRLKRDVVPSMLTTDKTAIRQDCLCYLMERLSTERAAPEVAASSAA